MLVSPDSIAARVGSEHASYHAFAVRQRLHPSQVALMSSSCAGLSRPYRSLIATLNLHGAAVFAGAISRAAVVRSRSWRRAAITAGRRSIIIIALFGIVASQLGIIMTRRGVSSPLCVEGLSAVGTLAAWGAAPLLEVLDVRRGRRSVASGILL